LPHYLLIEGFPYHQASLVHVLTAGNIGNAFSSAGICVLVQQTDLKKNNKTAAESFLFVSLGVAKVGRWFFFLNAGVNQLANTRSDVTIQRGNARRGINKEHASDLDSGNLTKTYPQNSLLLNQFILM
jgi:hypothetical protein